MGFDKNMKTNLDLIDDMFNLRKATYPKYRESLPGKSRAITNQADPTIN